MYIYVYMYINTCLGSKAAVWQCCVDPDTTCFTASSSPLPQQAHPHRCCANVVCPHAQTAIPVSLPTSENYFVEQFENIFIDVMFTHVGLVCVFRGGAVIRNRGCSVDSNLSAGTKVLTNRAFIIR